MSAQWRPHRRGRGQFRWRVGGRARAVDGFEVLPGVDHRPARRCRRLRPSQGEVGGDRAPGDFQRADVGPGEDPLAFSQSAPSFICARLGPIASSRQRRARRSERVAAEAQPCSSSAAISRTKSGAGVDVAAGRGFAAGDEVEGGQQPVADAGARRPARSRGRTRAAATGRRRRGPIAPTSSGRPQSGWPGPLTGIVLRPASEPSAEAKPSST